MRSGEVNPVVYCIMDSSKVSGPSGLISRFETSGELTLKLTLLDHNGGYQTAIFLKNC